MAGGEGGGAIPGDAVLTGQGEMRSLALTPTWSVATVLTLLVAGSLLIERSIHRLSNVSIPTSFSLLPAYYACTFLFVCFKMAWRVP
jgi:hypothetical protein